MTTSAGLGAEMGASGGSPVLALLVLGLGWGLPLLHVVLSRHAGPYLTAPGQRCPFGPRLAWIVMVLMLGPFGYALFWKKLRAVRAPLPVSQPAGATAAVKPTHAD